MASQTDHVPKPIQIQKYLESLIEPTERPELCHSVIPALTAAIAQIADRLRQSQQVTLAGSANAFGDDQLNVDLIAENVIRTALASCRSVVTVSSEEDPVERPASESNTIPETRNSHNKPEIYTVTFDPLDGSSIIGANWTVGTIIGIWDGSSVLTQHARASLVAAMIGIFGPRTTIVVALNVPSGPRACFEIGISSSSNNGEVTLVRPTVSFTSPAFGTRYFAPANLRAAADSPSYARLVNHYMQSKYTLRYSGGLVPDVMHMLTKGHGIYVSPVTRQSKAKLRLIYEVCPIALIVECAGGRAVNPESGEDSLEHLTKDCDERVGIVCGTAEEVSFALSVLLV